jgi:hypothetical protein
MRFEFEYDSKELFEHKKIIYFKRVLIK